ncbi:MULTISPECIES: hypothetical protein [Microbulbifer]|uniref:Uncharacterized protein n=1 Tax=Microbulbifer agarilyticus TaxID=260552 RepID=A0A1Q2M100_9GAMM|nr:hypothetical protein [Microbulbifer agarilyticus]AQQ66375.1 hypothetical protein Mag101_00965 [Microbulbifer agarilyticus]MBY6190672.1 hypothetical protein [Microbulbifer agarilyticus]MBY6211276.1 hypothetical protein [Microbulbifer agarilyticus]MCA0895010.1 hypothetical protein [Microbulbifer agarilyticus]MCA0899877.1 hypothetical protein [Microbulbifer agarilyticus]
MSYEWRNNLACLATYKILSGQNKMDQFDSEDYPLAQAGDLKLKNLRFRITSTSNFDGYEAKPTALMFFRALRDDYSPKKEQREMTSEQFLGELIELFASDEKTLTDLASTVDRFCKFEDEF